MVDELNFLPEDTGGGIIEIGKQEALNKLAQLAKKTLQAVDKTGVITSQITEDDLIEIGTGIKEKDPDRVKNVIGLNLEKIHSAVPTALLTAAGVNLGSPELMAVNIANDLIQTGGAVVEGLAGLDLGDNIFSETGEGILDVANTALNYPNYGIATLGGNMVSDLNRTYGNVVATPISHAWNKMYDFTSPFFNFLGSPFQTKEPKFKGMELPTVDPLPFVAPQITQDDTYLGGGATIEEAGGTAPGGGYATDYFPTYVPSPPEIISPHRAAGGGGQDIDFVPVYHPPPATTNEASDPYYTGDTGGSYGGGEDFGSPSTTSTPSRTNTVPPGRPRRGLHWAQGGLASMARVLRR